MHIRSEQAGEETTIFNLTQMAFASAPFSDGAEGPIVDRLRQDGHLTVSLVALKDEEIVGHIAFSPVTINENDEGWYGLGPISVHPDLQKQGIGRALIIEGLARIKALGAIGCVLVGDPAYYSRFDFRSEGDLYYGEVPTEYVQWLAFGPKSARGVLKYAPAFNDPNE